MILESLPNNVPLLKVGLSVTAIASLAALRKFVNQALLRLVDRSDLRRRWLVSLRNATVLLSLLALAAIWADALRPFAVSILAVAVAFVIATKELIQSALASMLRSATNMYAIGDRIEVGSFRGDVVDFNPFTTTLMEVGPGRTFHMRTGRTVTFPNSKLMDTYLVNESYTRDYVNHSFTISLKSGEEWEKAEQVLLEAANAECGPFLKDARERLKSLEQTQAVNGLAVTPRVAFQVSDPGKVSLLVRFPVPVGRQGRVEQAIIRRFLQQFYGEKEPETDSAATDQTQLDAVLAAGGSDTSDYII